MNELAVPDRKPRQRWRRRLLLGAGVLVVLLLVATGAIAGYLASTNKARADDWQAQAVQLQSNAERLQEVVDARTEDLNERTDELNQLAAKVAAAEQAIERSEADVKRLERRQRQLAAEKAQVEDARATLALQTSAIEDVASAYIDCNTGLNELLSYVLAENYLSASAIVGRVLADCDTADRTLDGYLATYG